MDYHLFITRLLVSYEHQKTTLKQSALFSCINILQALTVYVWHHELFIVSLGITLLLVLYLFMLYNTYPLQDKALSGRIPFSIYLAWMTFIFITNTSFTLTAYGWNGFGLSTPLWAVILLTLGGAIALHIRFHHFDVMYPSVLFGLILESPYIMVLMSYLSLQPPYFYVVFSLLAFYLLKNPAYQK